MQIPAHPLSAACHYAERGWPVFPCKPDKRPKTTHGFKDATTDTDAIRTNWAEYPDDLIGIATGFASGSRLLIIDLDDHKPGGTPEWDAFAASHGGLPATFTVRTGSGGRQFYYLTDRVIGSSQPAQRGDNVQNVDVRCDGGYIIAAPSVSEYGPYTVENSISPVAAPEWVKEFAERRPPRKERTNGEEVVYDPSGMTAEQIASCEKYADRVFELEIGRLRECSRMAVKDVRREKYTGPPWDATTFQVACNLLEIANSPWNRYTEEDAYQAIRQHAPRDSNFNAKCVLNKWDSARKTIGDKGRPMPPARSTVNDDGTVNHEAFFVRDQGLQVTVLAQAVLDLGPLAVEDNENRGIWAYRNGVWNPAPHEVSDRCAVLLGPRFRPNHVTTILPSIRQQLVADGALITCGPVSEYINCLNGMLSWKTGVLYGHDPGYLSTVQLPVIWDREATCPNFDLFIKQVMADDALEYLWEIIGYLVYSGNPLQRAFLFHGNGINGKGTLIRVLTALLGLRNTSSVTLADISDSKFEVASLFGKIANLAGDIDAAYMRNTAKFKAITGEDQIRAERKYEHSFKFQCWAVPVFSANEFWKSADTTTGYKRRWQLLPFPNTFQGQGKAGLSDELSKELPGILAHAVASLRVLMERGDFDTPKSAMDEKDRFELAADQVAEWLNEDPAISIADPTNDRVTFSSAEAYRQYKQWAEENGNGILPSSKWGQRIEALGYKRRKSGVIVIQGLSINTRLRLASHPSAATYAVN